MCTLTQLCSVMSNSFWPHGLLPARLPFPMGFSRQEYWSGLPCPPPGDLPDSGIESTSFTSPALAGWFFTTSAIWETQKKDTKAKGYEQRGLAHQRSQTGTFRVSQPSKEFTLPWEQPEWLKQADMSRFVHSGNHSGAATKGIGKVQEWSWEKASWQLQEMCWKIVRPQPTVREQMRQETGERNLSATLERCLGGRRGLVV